MHKPWDSEEIFFKGERYFESLLRDIQNAREYITIEMYIFHDDPLGERVALALTEAQKRGVRVQIIVDGIGSMDFFTRLFGMFQEVGIQVKIHNPLPFYHPYYGKNSFLRKIKILLSRALKINQRNHRKIITIDQKIMYAGSFNITSESLSWKDLGMRVSGDFTDFAVLNFKKSWKLKDYRRFRKKIRGIIPFDWKKAPLRLNQTIFMRNFFYKDLLKRVKRSQERVWLMTPYFIPKRRLIRMLGMAAKRGVDVRVLISQKSDVKFFFWLQFFYFNYLLKKGVKVYQYTDSVLHAKNFIIDDFMTIGSTNLNHRSFLHDLEMDLVIQEEANKEKIKEHFLTSTMSQKTITLELLKNRPLWDRFLGRLFFLFKYWF